MHALVRAATDYVGPVWLRSSRVALPYIYEEGQVTFEVGGCHIVRQGADLTIIACGIMVAAAMDAAVDLAEAGIHTPSRRLVARLVRPGWIRGHAAHLYVTSRRALSGLVTQRVRLYV